MTVTVAPADEETRLTRGELVLLVGRLVLGFVVLGLVVSFLATHYRPNLMALGERIVGSFGLPGMSAGTFIAEAFQFPIPPQFYMLTSIAAEQPPGPVLLAICIGSIFGGHTGMFLAGHAAKLAIVRRALERGPLGKLFRRHGPLAVTIASLLPVPYSLLCYSCGLFRFRYRVFALACALRIPKLVLYYAIIRAGWMA